MPRGIRATAAVVIATTKPGNDAISSPKWDLHGEWCIQSKILSVYLICYSGFILADRCTLAIVWRHSCSLSCSILWRFLFAVIEWTVLSYFICLIIINCILCFICIYCFFVSYIVLFVYSIDVCGFGFYRCVWHLQSSQLTARLVYVLKLNNNHPHSLVTYHLVVSSEMFNEILKRWVVNGWSLQ